jgi:hypothetical protein
MDGSQSSLIVGVLCDVYTSLQCVCHLNPPSVVLGGFHLQDEPFRVAGYRVMSVQSVQARRPPRDILKR